MMSSWYSPVSAAAVWTLVMLALFSTRRGSVVGRGKCGARPDPGAGRAPPCLTESRSDRGGSQARTPERSGAGRSPAALASAVLLVEPRLERREVIEDRGRVHLLGPGELGEHFGPRPAPAEFEHRLEATAGLLVPVDRAAVERALVPGGLAEGAVELELEDVRQEVAGVGHVRRDVVLRARVEPLLAARHRRPHALVPLPQLPPRPVVGVRPDLVREDLPAPLVDEQAERQERDLVERVAHEEPEVAGRV